MQRARYTIITILLSTFSEFIINADTEVNFGNGFMTDLLANIYYTFIYLQQLLTRLEFSSFYFAYKTVNTLPLIYVNLLIFRINNLFS